MQSILKIEQVLPRVVFSHEVYLSVSALFNIFLISSINMSNAKLNELGILEAYEG